MRNRGFVCYVSINLLAHLGELFGSPESLGDEFHQRHWYLPDDYGTCNDEASEGKGVKSVRESKYSLRSENSEGSGDDCHRATFLHVNMILSTQATCKRIARDHHNVECPGPELKALSLDARCPVLRVGPSWRVLGFDDMDKLVDALHRQLNPVRVTTPEYNQAAA